MVVLGGGGLSLMSEVPVYWLAAGGRPGLLDHPQLGRGSRDPHPDKPSEHGTHKTVKARFWPWLSGKMTLNLLSYSLLARATKLLGWQPPLEGFSFNRPLFLVCRKHTRLSSISASRKIAFQSGSNLPV